MPKNAQNRSSPASTRISRLLACALTAGSLLSCSALQTPPLQVPTVSAPAQCLPRPEPLPLLTDPSLEGLLRHLILTANAWWELKGKHDCLKTFDELR